MDEETRQWIARRVVEAGDGFYEEQTVRGAVERALERVPQPLAERVREQEGSIVAEMSPKRSCSPPS